MSDYETLRRTIAEAIRGEPMRDEPTWDLLHDSRKESYLDDADRVLAAIEAAQAKDVLLARAELHADFDAWEVENRRQDFQSFMFQAGISHEVRNAVLTETSDFFDKLAKWLTKGPSPDKTAHEAGNFGHWVDSEMVAEFKRLEDADCVTLDVWIGAPPMKRDASHYLPRLLDLAARGLGSIDTPSNGDDDG